MFKPSTHDAPPWGLRWRSNTFFIVSTVGIGAFTDFFLYGLIVPVLPFMLEDRVNIPDHEIQSTISWLLAIYAAASMIMSPIAGFLADRMSGSRQLPFLLGLALLLVSTILLAVGRSVPVIALARFLQGASGGAVWTIGLALLLETVGQENLGKAIGSVFSFTSVAGLFAPVIGGLLYAKSGYKGVFGVGIALIGVDFLMRLLMIEKKVAARYKTSSTPPPEIDGATAEPDETSPFLSSSGEDLSAYRLPEPKQRITRALPILLLLKDPGMITALVIGLMQAILLGAFDATVPLVASSRYGFDSLKAGLLFLPLAASDFLLGPLFGWCVDRWGTKPITVVGFLYLVPTLVLLRIPTEAATHLRLPHQVALYASLLLLNGIGLAIINSPSIVESGHLVEKYWKANEDLFEDQAPYAQLYGINSMLWSLGLTVGPLLAGKLREEIGYGNMNAVLAGLCAFTAVLGFLFVGGKVPWGRFRNNGSGEVL
ncbi:major facilitator superfamily domain-containing protein [Lophiotrema nucula]|uniref:Major facilitator superfamily domain-containing protein n=1 Tax=Lophiotrema nucula TaxID=690887 RepID=A0A6A5ZP68_9PLEO|nr:major facilitator superfamily domain-containing protein [Lophiotrema nucula]